MSNANQDLWESRPLLDGIVLEMQAGDTPALILVQDENRVRIELAHVKAMLAALAGAAANLTTILATGGEYHA
jgi:hypothetical protein